MQIRAPQSEIGQYTPGISDDHAGGPLSREGLIDLGKSMLDLAERIEVVGLTQGALAAADGLRLQVNRFSEWSGYRAKGISRWDQDVRDALLRLGGILNRCYVSDGRKHGDDEIAKELRTLGSYAGKLTGPKTDGPLRVEGDECLYGESILEIPTGKATEVFQVLVENFGKVATWKTLGCEGSKPKEADDQVRQAKAHIASALEKAKAPYEIATMRGVGYRLQDRKTKNR